MKTKRMTLLVISSISLLLLGCGPGGGRDLSNRQWLDLQRDLQRERSKVGQQRDQLETDRRTLDVDRKHLHAQQEAWRQRKHLEPILAEAIKSSALVLVCGLPLLLIAILLWPREATDQGELDELLIEQVITLQDSSEPSPKRITSNDPAKLTLASNDSG